MWLTDRVALIAGPEADAESVDDCNVYVITTSVGAVMIDTGVGRSIDGLIRVAQAEGIDLNALEAVLLTHAHLDHAGGAALIYERFGVPIYASAETARRVAEADEESIALPAARSAGMYRASDSLRPCPIEAIQMDAGSLEVGDVAIHALATPGHSADHTSYLADVAGMQMLFAGDLLFPGGQVALLSTHDCCIQQLVASLEMLRDLEFEGLLSGHLLPRMSDAKADRDSALNAINQLVLPRSIV